MKYLFILIDPLKKIEDRNAFRAVIALLMVTCFVTGYFVVDAAVEIWNRYDKSKIQFRHEQENK